MSATEMPQPIVVWSEIPVSDINKAVDFYNSVFDWQMTIDSTSGPNPMAMLGGVMNTIGGNLYEGPTGTGSTIHIAVPDSVEAAADRCRAAGGEVLGDVIEIPAGRFAYAKDLDGNSLGLFQAAA